MSYSLASISKGKKAGQPLKMVVYGPAGVGKSTFAAGAPSPFFLDVEAGSHFLDVSREDNLPSYDAVLQVIKALILEDHGFSTLVVDTLDALEPMIWAHVCKRDGKSNIEDYGYGHGYGVAHKEWLTLQKSFGILASKKGMNIILLAHSEIKLHKDPAGNDYDAHSIALHKAARKMWEQWAAFMFFCDHERVMCQDNDASKRAAYTGGRLVYTAPGVGYAAKSRVTLPSPIELCEDTGNGDAFESFRELYAAATESAEVEKAAEVADQSLVAQIYEVLGKLEADEQRTIRPKVEELIEQNDNAKLARCLERLTLKAA